MAPTFVEEAVRSQDSFYAVAAEPAGALSRSTVGCAAFAVRDARAAANALRRAGHGPEFQVNTSTTNNQVQPKVASDPAGDYVAVWSSYQQTGNESYGVYGAA